MKRLYRSENSMFCGVCKGLAERFNVNATIIRAIFLLMALFLGMRAAVVYLILVCSIPTESYVKNNDIIVNKKWHRSANNDKFISLGVCRGIAEKFEIDVTPVRVIILSLFFLFSNSLMMVLIAIYLIAGMILPVE